MKGLFVRIDPRLDRELTELCRREGLKKSGVLSRLIGQFVKEHRGALDPVREAEEFGIDTTLLYGNLQKSPTERLRNHERFHAFVEEARKQGVKK